MNSSEIRDRIFTLLSERGIEQKEFASLVGTTDKTVSAWKTGRVDSFSSMKWLPQIAAVLGTTVEYLLTGETKKGPAAEDGHEPSENELLFRSLSPEKQKEALRYMRYLASQEAAPGEGPDR